MNEIFFVRHAKSSWADSSLADIERPLNARGLRDAPFMAQKLAQIVPDIDLFICSPAQRARETCQYFINEIKPSKVEINDRVYHAWSDTLIDVVSKISNDVRSALIFGHNPGFTSVFNHFSQDYLDNLPTCGIFQLKIDVPWEQIDKTNTQTGLLIYPKLYR